MASDARRALGDAGEELVARWYARGREWSVPELVEAHRRLLMDGVRIARPRKR